MIAVNVFGNSILLVVILFWTSSIISWNFNYFQKHKILKEDPAFETLCFWK
jgi:hypothetical protein